MGRSKKPTAAELKKIRLVKMIQEVTSSGSSKDTWNPAEISEGLKNINFIRRLVDTWNPAQLNEAIRLLGFKTIDTWNPAIIDEMKTALIRMFLPKTATGNPITLNLDGELPYTIQETKVIFNPKQSGTGDPSPTNIRPISGWDGLNLKRSGKNLCDQNSATTTSSGSLNLSSVGTFGKVKSGLIYTFSFTPLEVNTLGLQLRLNNVSGGIKGWSANTLVVNQRETYTFTATEDGELNFYSQNNCFTESTKVFDNIQLELGSTATAYEPYQGETHTATFPDTVYGGFWNPIEGKAVITHEIVDLGSLTWSMTSTSGCFRTHGLDSLAELGTTGQPDAISTVYTNKPTTRDVESLPDYSFCVGGSQSSYKLFLKDTRYTSASDFESAISGQKICYKLATPTEIALTAEQIELLKGTNVFSTDADTLNIKYQIDLS